MNSDPSSAQHAFTACHRKKLKEYDYTHIIQNTTTRLHWKTQRLLKKKKRKLCRMGNSATSQTLPNYNSAFPNDFHLTGQLSCTSSANEMLQIMSTHRGNISSKLLRRHVNTAIKPPWRWEWSSWSILPLCPFKVLQTSPAPNACRIEYFGCFCSLLPPLRLSITWISSWVVSEIYRSTRSYRLKP